MSRLSKKEYQHNTELELKKIHTRIIELEKKIQKAEAGIKVRHDQKMSQIRGHYAQTKERLNDLQSSSQDTWPELKSLLDEDIDLLNEATENMSQHILKPQSPNT